MSVNLPEGFEVVSTGQKEQPEGLNLPEGFEVVSGKGTGFDPLPQQPELKAPQQAQEDSGVLDKIYGAGEAGLSMLTGGTTGAFGYASGVLGGVVDEILEGNFGTNEAAKRIQDRAMKSAQMGTYVPKTDEGLQAIQTVGEYTEFLNALPPVMAEAQLISNATRRATQLAPAINKKLPLVGKRLSPEIANNPESLNKINSAAKVIRQSEAESLSAGAMQAGKESVRRGAAEGTMVPFRLTKGEATRNPDQLKFEIETSKLEGGARLRERYQEHNTKLRQNFDSMVDEVGSLMSESPEETGQEVVKFIQDGLDFQKKRVSAYYNIANLKGAMKSKVDMQPLATYMNESRADRLSAPVMRSLQEKIDVMEIGKGSFEDGSLSLPQLTVKQAEELLQHINKNTDQMNGNDKFKAGQLKQVIDAQTENVGNKDYKAARAQRVLQAEMFENVGIVRDLLKTKKGTTDRAIALEDVMQKIALGAGAKNEGLRHIKDLMTKQGTRGRQVWREVQGSALTYLRDKATTTATDANGTPIMSSAALSKTIDSWEKSGKLDILFSGRVKQNMILLRDVAEYIRTQPPGVVNHSNTASTLAMLTDLVLTSQTGLPVPVALGAQQFIGLMKNRKLQKRISDALGEID